MRNRSKIPVIKKSINVSNSSIDNNEKTKQKSKKYGKLIWLMFAGLIVILVKIWLVKFETNNQSEFKIPNEKSKQFPPNPEIELPPSSSKMHMFKHAAIITDSPECTEIGRYILLKGNVVDSAIATMFCNGILTMQSMGIGGGFIMNLFIQKDQKAYTINARERAPRKKSPIWYTNSESRFKGPLSIATPGEIRGYWEIYKRFGTLPWMDLIKPTIEICAKGFKLTKHMADFLFESMKSIPHFRKMFVNKETNEFLKEGSHIFPSENLCNLYRMIAENGGDDFYNGNISKIILQDLKDAGSILTKKDFEMYKCKWSESIPVRIGNNILYVTPAPSSGLIVSFILKLLETLKLTRNMNQISIYHKIIETLKFAYSERSKLSDPDFHTIDKLIKNLTSSKHAQQIRLKIQENKTLNDFKYYGDELEIARDYGTSHISIMGSNGDAVSVTSSLNFYFGSGVIGNRSGIIFNNGIDDFSFENSTNYFRLPMSKLNLIDSRKQSITSMAPIIVADENGKVKIVIGAAGGSKIPSAIAQILFKLLSFEYNVKEAVDEPRIHHQLYPMHVEYEYGISESIVKGLENFDHKTIRYELRKSIVMAITKNSSGLFSCVDFRKCGKVDGF